MGRVTNAVLLGLLFAAAPASATSPRRPGPDDVCPVCGMVVSLYDEWVAQVVLEDGSALFFDGSKDLFRYLLDRDRLAHDRAQVAVTAVFVTGYYEVKAIPAREAWFVVGSDVLGPMGAELVAHASRAEAEEFLHDHGGRAIVGYEEITAELLAALDQAKGGVRP